jgi:hypothetical protein
MLQAIGTNFRSEMSPFSVKKDRWQLFVRFLLPEYRPKAGLHGRGCRY